MKTKPILSKFLHVLLLLLTAFSSFAQREWDFGGGHKLLVDKASYTPLKATMLSGSLSDYNFLAKVGGVAFFGTAVPAITLNSPKVSLAYMPTRRDGSRLRVIINRDTVYPKIYDWQLIPIAKYSNSDYNACVSLFGENQTNYSYDISYHSAFGNTLLGLRLLEADILLMDPFSFWQLPKYEGKVVLGRGEKNTDSLKYIIPALKIQEALKGQTINSWVITDANTTVTFSIENGKFKLTGNPYHYFWSADRTEISIYNYYKYLEEQYLLHNENADLSDFFINQGRENKPKIINKLILTEQMKNMRSDLEMLNPSVFNALRNTMQYSAFFRYVKSHNLSSWITFCYQIEYVAIKPDVVTPTAYPTIRH